MQTVYLTLAVLLYLASATALVVLYGRQAVRRERMKWVRTSTLGGCIEVDGRSYSVMCVTDEDVAEAMEILEGMARRSSLLERRAIEDIWDQR